MKILVVEDEVLIAEGIEMTLSAIGHQVIGIARNLGEAVDLARELSPEMAFVDIKLAHGSCGLDVARELTALGITCVFATANPPDPNRARGLGLGVHSETIHPPVAGADGRLCRPGAGRRGRRAGGVPIPVKPPRLTWRCA